MKRGKTRSLTPFRDWAVPPPPGTAETEILVRIGRAAVEMHEAGQHFNFAVEALGAKGNIETSGKKLQAAADHLEALCDGYCAWRIKHGSDPLPTT